MGCKLLVYLTIYTIASVEAFDGYKLFKDHADDDFPATLPTYTRKPDNDLFGKIPPSLAPVTSTPSKGLSILDVLMKEIERKKRKQRRKMRRKIEAWIRGRRSTFGMSSSDQSGPQCSACSSNNMAECARTAKTRQCSSTNQCYTVNLVHRQSDQSSVIKGCIDKSNCKENVCKKIVDSSSGAYKHCKLDCCQGNMCNKLEAPKPLPKQPGQKCYSCQGFDEASCAAKRRETQCETNNKCATVFVVQKTDGKGILAKGCIAKTICDSGLCKSLNESGRYSSCNGTCCTGNLCNGVNVTPSAKPVTKPTVSTASPQVKCVICVGSNKAQCDSRSIVRQCQVGERCYSGGARISGTPTTSFSRGCTRFSIDECKSYCKTVEGRLENCTYRCCDGNLCNKPGGTPSTQRPVTGSVRLSCSHCQSQVSENDCDSGRELKQCDSDRVCYFGRARYQSGEKLFAKGCMKPDECRTACNRLGPGAKFCNVTCCKENDCNRQIVTPTPTSSVKNPNIRALLKLIEAFRILLEAIENSIRASAMDFKASDYKGQLSSLMEVVDSHSRNVAATKSPGVRDARKELMELRKRAGEVLKRLGDYP